MRCLVCAGLTQAVGDRFDDRYGYPGCYVVHRCAGCGHMQMAVSMSPQQIASLYTDYYPRSERTLDDWQPPGEETGVRAWWSGTRASAFRWVPPGVRVLDIGCGFGESLGYHRARGCDAHGVEADANIVRVAQRYGLNARHGLFDATQYAADSFDFVTLDQVIEHMADPQALLEGVHRILKPGGRLVVATPNVEGWGARVFGRRWLHWHAPYHQQFFTRRSLAQAAAAHGFVIEQHATITNSAWLGYQAGHLVTFSSEGVPSAFWSTRTPRTLGQRILLKLLSFVDRAKVNNLITRAFDAVGLGDNMLCVFRKQP